MTRLDQSVRAETELRLAGYRLHLSAPTGALLERVTSVLVPACEVMNLAVEPDWSVWIGEDPRPGGSEETAADRPELVLPRGGPRLTVLDNQGGRLRVSGRYRPDWATAVIEVDACARRTQLVLPAGDTRAVRWCDWLAKVFFASRLLQAGWRMLHASAVAIDGRALLFLAGQRGGKSTLAHRACTELGAAFLADDLVLLGPDGTVVGWPTRVCLPVDLPVPRAVGTLLDGVVDGQVRRRLRLTPAEHRTALGVTYSPPLPLGMVVVIARTDAPQAPAVRAVPLDRDALASAAAEALDVPAQRLFTSDLLGLTGGPRTSGSADADDVARELSEVPGALLRVGDPTMVPTAPVWDALIGLVPGVAVGT
ncbi:hypothetical protein BFF78_36180 [Streptomyces fodineus]|uniref:Serine kinase n=1 Tax=Streptomyces fodineus TaxID=1904616 RepID=A0A1D7YKB4_9ACTN|nr:hypothetical protein [Streptomyces fodineus]AOR35789.1 hypothetical protein BFF78_36180 [Streptomyces fodineus]